MSGFDFAPMGDQLDHREAWTAGQRLNVEIGRLRAENDAIRNMLADSIVVHHDDQAEIDRLRAESAAFRDLADCCSDCEWEGVEIVHRPMCARWQSAEIAEVADRIANGRATCGAPWRDTEATGWLWYCSLPVGHAGHHRCIGATW